MEEKKGLFSGIGRNILLLGIVSLLTDMSSEMINPIIPLFLQDISQAGDGAFVFSGFVLGLGLVIGLIGGLGDSVSSIIALISGYWSDRNGRRIPFIFTGYGLSSVTKFFFAAINAPWQMVVLKPIERVGKGMRGAPRDAIIAESRKEVRGKAFGIHRTMDSLGALLGSLLAFIIVYYLLDSTNPDATYRNIFIVSGFIGLLALIPITMVKDVKREPQKRGLLLNLKLMPKNFKLFLLVATLFSMGNFTIYLFILHSQEVFKAIISDMKMAAAISILLYIWYNLFNTLFSVPAGVLSDRFGRRKVLAAGYLLFAASCIGFASTYSFIAFTILFALYGIAVAFVDGTQRALAADLIPADIRGTALGTFYTLTAVATLPGSVLAGFFWDNYGAESAFLYGAAMASLSLVAFTFIGYRRVQNA